MSLNLARRGLGALRGLQLSDAFSRPVRVAIAQTHVRRICLSTFNQSLRPISRARQYPGFLSQRLVKAYATSSDEKSAKKKTTKTGKTKSSTKSVKKTKPKAKPKPTPKRSGRKPATEKQKEAAKAAKTRQSLKDLKATALEPPKRLAERVWNLAVSSKLPEAQKVHKTQMEAFKGATDLAKLISEEEREQFAKQAEANRATNEAEYEKWIKSHTPLQIKEANQARARLTKITNKKYFALRDDRLVKRPTPAYMIFYIERVEQGDFKHMQVKDISARVSEEWKGLTDSERQKYIQLQNEEKERYHREYREVYGEEPASSPEPESKTL
ncbi:hypothetical protein BDV25DRAFT_33775 [Aspergillus avenaceus]|uniref:HMG box domain-containing protein n=1 Tax=Aspergillus avenaceus TaxID=36643 RepID=A0A5N6TMS9_ASPAV|nr:hypothetical protein BDV25DRAFT_33775 [Aspergillus avenaceus]